jgi:hypothetical protein
MKLTQLAAKPQLIKITLDEEDIVANYGDALEFWIYDRQDLETFAKLAMVDAKQFDKLAGLINNMILDEDGTPVVKNGLSLPSDVLMKAIQKVVDVLGKPIATSTSTSLTQS